MADALKQLDPHSIEAEIESEQTEASYQPVIERRFWQLFSQRYAELVDDDSDQGRSAALRLLWDHYQRARNEQQQR